MLLFSPKSLRLTVTFPSEFLRSREAQSVVSLGSKEYQCILSGSSHLVSDSYVDSPLSRLIGVITTGYNWGDNYHFEFQSCSIVLSYRLVSIFPSKTHPTCAPREVSNVAAPRKSPGPTWAFKWENW